MLACHKEKHTISNVLKYGNIQNDAKWKLYIRNGAIRTEDGNEWGE